MWISEKTASHMCLQRKLADDADWGKCEITLPLVPLGRLVSKYFQEKPNQPRCSHCGALYLWRLQIKSWELACWQVSAPEHATILPCTSGGASFDYNLRQREYAIHKLDTRTLRSGGNPGLQI